MPPQQQTPVPALPTPQQAQADHPAQPHDDQGVPHDLKAPGGGTVALVAGAFVLLLVALALVAFIPDLIESRKVRQAAQERQSQKPVAEWARPTASTGESDVTLPCDVEAYASTALYTRATGFLQAWHPDIGASVKRGDVLAEISAPDAVAQLNQSQAAQGQAEAAVKRADAQRHLAEVTYNRFIESQKQNANSVTQEDVDTKKAQLDDADAALAQARANVDAAKADVRQRQEVVNFDVIKAPYDGIITARNFDRQAFLSPTVGKEIYDIAETDKLRVFVNVPQTYANNVRLHDAARFGVRNYPDREFFGVIEYTTGALDPNTRTLKVQIDFDNANQELKPGMYGQLKLPVTAQVPVSRIPSSALIFNAQGLYVDTIDAQNKIHRKTVKVGRDFGVDLEITTGLDPADRVVVNPGERFAEGTPVDAREQPTGQAPGLSGGAKTQPASRPMTPVTTAPYIAPPSGSADRSP